MERGKVFERYGQERMVLRLPRLFYEDHRERDLPSGNPKRWLKRQVDVEMVREEFNELLDDARAYANGEGWEFDGMRTVIESARRTVRALEPYESEEAWR